MKAATRLLASVKPTRLLEFGQPTGLTGLHTHPAPHSALLYFYNSTLEKLQKFPESSVYRQATENLTKQRLEIVQKIVPAGYDEWQKRSLTQAHAKLALTGDIGGEAVAAGGKTYLNVKVEGPFDEDTVEWDGQESKAEPEGSKTAAQGKSQRRVLGEGREPEESEDLRIEIETEPRYTIEQVEQLEAELGAGLLEEVIDVAGHECSLVDTMLEAKVWDELEIKAPEGQWSYFERATHHTKS